VKWAEQKPIWISWKLDGLTLVVTYDNGKLTKVVTRGNGHIGTNITHLASAISGIPATIPAQGHTVIRGEAVISYDDFDRFLMESGEDYANPRNLASGSLTLKDVEEVRQRHIQWIPFTLVYTEEDINSWGGRMDWLDHQGFNTVERQLVNTPDIGSVGPEYGQERAILEPAGVKLLIAQILHTVRIITGPEPGHAAFYEEGADIKGPVGHAAGRMLRPSAICFFITSQRALMSPDQSIVPYFWLPAEPDLVRFRTRRRGSACLWFSKMPLA
jgi:hypothetical protein